MKWKEEKNKACTYFFLHDIIYTYTLHGYLQSKLLTIIGLF
jgi:hypothetical protein